jgi:hypothetical protein
MKKDIYIDWDKAHKELMQEFYKIPIVNTKPHKESEKER